MHRRSGFQPRSSTWPPDRQDDVRKVFDPLQQSHPDRFVAGSRLEAAPTEACFAWSARICYRLTEQTAYAGVRSLTSAPNASTRAHIHPVPPNGHARGSYSIRAIPSSSLRHPTSSYSPSRNASIIEAKCQGFRSEGSCALELGGVESHRSNHSLASSCVGHQNFDWARSSKKPSQYFSSRKSWVRLASPSA